MVFCQLQALNQLKEGLSSPYSFSFKLSTFTVHQLLNRYALCLIATFKGFLGRRQMNKRISSVDMKFTILTLQFGGQEAFDRTSRRHPKKLNNYKKSTSRTFK